MKRTIIIMSGVTVAAALAVAALLPWGIEYYLTRVLQQQGMQLQHFSLERVSTEQAIVGDIRLREHSGKLELQAEQVRLDYSLPMLLDSRFDTIALHIQRLRVTQYLPKTTGSSTINWSSPLPLLAEVPLARIQIDELQLQQRDDQQPLHDVQGALTIQPGQIHAQLREQQASLFQGMQATFDLFENGDLRGEIHHQDQALAVLQGHLKRQQQQLQLDATASMQLEPLTGWLKPMVMKAPLRAQGTLEVSLTARAPAGDYATLHDWLQVLESHVHTRFNGALQHRQLRAQGELDLTVDMQRGTGRWSLAPHSHVDVRDPMTHVQLSQHRLNGGIRLNRELTPLLTLDATSQVQWKVLRYQDWVLDGLAIHNRKKLQLTGAQAWQAVQCDVLPPPLRWQQQRISTDGVEIAVQKKGTALHAQMLARRFSVQGNDGQLPPGDVRIDGVWQADAYAQLRYQFSPQSEWVFDVHAIPAKKSADVDFKVMLDQPLAQLKKLYPASQSWLKPITLSSGSATSEGRLRVLPDGRWQAAAVTRLQDFAGSWNEMAFSGVRADVQSNFDGYTLLVPAAELNVASLNIGVPLHDIVLRTTAEYRVGANVSGRIHQFALHGLEGTIEASDVAFDSDALDRDRGLTLPLSIRGISLAELVALEKQQGLSASGLLDGELPLTVQRQGLSVQQGRLAARQPGGVIHYTGGEEAKAMGGQNPGIQLALDVLQDFQYHHLSSDVDYQRDGTMQLGLHIKGKNPAYDGGRPVEMNIQVEENLITLLKSLNLANDIEHQVQRKMTR